MASDLHFELIEQFDNATRQPRPYLSRRGLLKAGTVLAGVALIAGCSQAQMIAATLANSLSETTAIWAAIQGFVPASVSGPVSTAISTASAAVTAFEASSGDTALQKAEAVVNAVTPLLSLLPIPAVTVAAIKAGLGLVEAFATGVAAIAAPAPSAAVGAVPVRVIAAPIPIPVPVS